MLDEYDQWRRQNAGLYRDVSPSAFRDARDLQRFRQQIDSLGDLLGRSDEGSAEVTYTAVRQILEGRE